MRILFVSNRLPFTISERDGEFRFQESVGGLVSGIRSYTDTLKGSSRMAEGETGKSGSTEPFNYLWVGWPGSAIEEKNREEVKEKALSQFHAYPVFLSEKVVGKFYYGFCNKTLWPLFHYFPSYTVYDETTWTQYQKVNQTFSQALLEVLKPGDIVWIQDFHLMLLPRLLRERMPDLPIGFFLHIPFPSFETFRLLPGRWRREILEGLLGADLIGFHTHEYTQYFLRSLLRILGEEHEMGEILHKNRIVKAGTFPMGIDFQKFYNAIEDPEVQRERARIGQMAKELKIILSIDRLDYTKGILNRLKGYENLLEKNPRWRGKVLLIMVVVPSRTAIEQYGEMKKKIEELVGRINGRFGSIDWTPILYQYRFLPIPSLLALYGESDVALVTPLRDGMNLIAKEYIATRRDQTGVLILSEMAGASQELGEAILINPNNREEIGEALAEALEMPEEDQKRRNRMMQERLKNYDVHRWADDFIQTLLCTKEKQNRYGARFLASSLKEDLVRNYRSAQRRLIFLDYDGTLVPFVEMPQEAIPPERVLQILKALSEDPRNEVVLISGRVRKSLDCWFGMIPIALVAEHGIWLKEKGKEWRMVKPLTNDWKPQILPLLERYVERLPGAHLEEKEFSLVWHFRGADPELASLRKKELMDDLVHFTANRDIQVLQGSKVVEVKNSGVNKGTAALHWISENENVFTLAIGDDLTDEDLFMALPTESASIRVGKFGSNARYNLPSPEEVLQLLEELTKKD